MARLWVPLDVDFQDDDRIVETSLEAELLYVRSLALAKRLACDGRIRLAHLRRLSDKLPGDVHDHAAELVDAGLWRVDEWGKAGEPRVFTITSWLRWNDAVDDLDGIREAKRRGGKRGNHSRYGHSGPVEECSICYPPPDEDSHVSHSESHSESHSDRMALAAALAPSSQETETETETTPPRTHAREAAPEPVDNPGGTATPQPPTPPAQRVLERIAGNAPPHITAALTKLGRHQENIHLVDQALDRGWATHALADTINRRGWDNVHDPPKALTARLQRIGDPPTTTPPPYQRDHVVPDDPGSNVATRSAALDEIRATLTTTEDQP